MGRTQTTFFHGTFHGNLNGKISNLHETLLQQTRSKQHISSADQAQLTRSSALDLSRTPKFLRPFATSGCFTHPPPMCSRSPTSTPHRSGKLPPTHYIWFSFHGPRPVSHLTPPGTRHSRPARPRGRPCLVTNTPLSAVHPPRCSCLTKSEWPGVPAQSLRDHGPRAS